MRMMRTVLVQQTQIAGDVSALRNDVTRAITRLEVIESRNRMTDQEHGDFETRIRLLERFRYTVVGFSVLGGFLSGFIGYYVGHLVR